MPKLDMVNVWKWRNEFVNIEGRVELDLKRIEDKGAYLDVKFDSRSISCCQWVWGWEDFKPLFTPPSHSE